ncbi:jg17917 [Pararge aegeria aegeria]|uniref:Jg17917 protein n=1 Tax=Pararge aegeria aegeria TaxID=348720 RepID=A0A8S4RMH8_9NEOP|nr:jg17917 [Pararge aegeria aegeria]
MGARGPALRSPARMPSVVIIGKTFYGQYNRCYSAVTNPINRIADDGQTISLGDTFPVQQWAFEGSYEPTCVVLPLPAQLVEVPLLPMQGRHSNTLRSGYRFSGLCAPPDSLAMPVTLVSDVSAHFFLIFDGRDTLSLATRVKSEITKVSCFIDGS